MRWADLLTRMEEMKGAYNVSVSQNSSCTYKRNIEALWRNHCYLGKAVSITYSERVCVAFGIQHAMRMRHSVISDLSGSAVFFHISQMARCSEKKIIKHKMRILIFSATLSQIFVILKKTERDVIRNVHRSSCKVPVINVRF